MPIPEVVLEYGSILFNNIDGDALLAVGWMDVVLDVSSQVIGYVISDFSGEKFQYGDQGLVCFSAHAERAVHQHYSTATRYSSDFILVSVVNGEEQLDSILLLTFLRGIHDHSGEIHFTSIILALSLKSFLDIQYHMGSIYCLTMLSRLPF